MADLDPKNVLGSTGMLADQCEQIWQDSKGLEFPPQYKTCQNIILCGMGGSAYGGYVVSSLFKMELKVPIISNNNYNLPAFADTNSLAILSSYSGSTEETLSAALQAKEKGLKITGITGGGKLGEFFVVNTLPASIFNPKHNPSGQPRLGTGYMVLGTIAILTKLGYLQVSDKEVGEAVEELKSAREGIKSQAEELAKQMKGYIPIIFGAEHLVGNAHIIRNQFNETSKSFSAYEDIPELNHHLMEGFKNPKDKKLKTIFLASDSYPDKIKKRLKLTEDVVEQNGVEYLEYRPAGKSKLAEVLNVLSFGGYLTLYLAFNYGQDPSLIPWVDYFKKQLEHPTSEVGLLQGRTT